MESVWKSEQAVRTLVDAFARHRIEPVIDREFSFDDAPAAYDALAAANHVGKIVITTEAGRTK